MSTAELKLDLINKIANIKELYIIEDIKKLIDFELDETLYQVNEQQRKRLVSAQIDEVITEKEANYEIDKWLNEQ